MSKLRDGIIPFTKSDIMSYIDRTAQDVVQYMIERNFSLSAAESCTGGLLCSAVTSVAGASRIFEYGAVTYSNRVKEMLLGVSPEIIEKYGVVSAETASSMSNAVKKLSGSDFGVGITGLAGPASETDTLPVGTVFISIAYKDRTITENLRLYELGSFDRNINRLLTVAFVLEELQSLIRNV